MPQRLYRMIWLQKEAQKPEGTFGWARQNFEVMRENYSHLHSCELTIFTDNPHDPVIEVLTLTRYAQLTNNQCFSICETIAMWLKTKNYIIPESIIDVWQMIYRKH